MTTIELIDDLISPLSPTDTVQHALALMLDCKVSHLPLVNQSTFEGIISEESLLDKDDENLTLGEINLTTVPVSISQSDHFYNALRLMAQNRLSLIAVTSQDNTYLGALTAETAMREITETMSLGNPGGIIVLQVNETDFSLSEIARIVESNDAKILSMGVSNLPNNGSLQITLKLNRINIESVLQTFTRFEYNIPAYFGMNEKDEDLLRDRYDSLMMYLKL
ncbi:MAG TPA: CBS domain-containing protein [Bacteroidales bacterium]|nr:CBS domain-containing protein [Bacteroidales bacterium]